MGRLSGFRYRDIVRRLKSLGFEFDRQDVGSHEIWFNPASNRDTAIAGNTSNMPRQADVSVDDFVG